MVNAIPCDSRTPTPERHRLVSTMSVEDLEPMVGSFMDAEYCDDCVFMLALESAQSLYNVTIGLTSQVRDVFNDHGLVLNFKAGKTEAIINFRGRGSLQLKHLLSDSLYHISLPSRSGSNDMLRVVARYKHMGNIIRDDGAFTDEINYRNSMAYSSYAKLRAKVFKNKVISTEVRVNIYNSLVGTRRLYNARHPHQKSVTKVLAFQMRALKDIFDCPNYDPELEPTTDVAVMAKARVPSACVMMKIARMRFASRLLHGKGKSCLHMIAAAGSAKGTWLDYVFSDLEWLRLILGPKLNGLLEPRDDPRAWFSFIRSSKVSWNTLLKRAMCESEGLLFRSDTVQIDPYQVQATCYIQCDSCSLIFPSLPELLNHKQRAHGYRHVSRGYILFN